MKIVKYGPLTKGKLDATVVAVGLVGVYRATQLDFVSDEDIVLWDIKEESKAFYPEFHNFFVMEICKGSHVLSNVYY